LAYINFVHGSLAGTLAQKLDQARAPFKALRDAETALQPHRTLRNNLHTNIDRFQNDPKKAEDFRQQLHKLEQEDAAAERDIELLKRKALRESEQLKWAAIQEVSPICFPLLRMTWHNRQ